MSENDKRIHFSKKGSRDTPNRSKTRPKKRKFQGNQNSHEPYTDEHTTTSTKKLRDSKSLGASYKPTIDYVILSFTQFFYII